MTKFKAHQISKFLTDNGIKQGTASLLDYERAKSLLFPFGRRDPLPDLDYGETVRWLSEYLRV